MNPRRRQEAGNDRPQKRPRRPKISPQRDEEANMFKILVLGPPQVPPGTTVRHSLGSTSKKAWKTTLGLVFYEVLPWENVKSIGVAAFLKPFSWPNQHFLAKKRDSTTLLGPFETPRGGPRPSWRLLGRSWCHSEKQHLLIKFCRKIRGFMMEGSEIHRFGCVFLTSDSAKPWF